MMRTVAAFVIGGMLAAGIVLMIVNKKPAETAQTRPAGEQPQPGVAVQPALEPQPTAPVPSAPAPTAPKPVWRPAPAKPAPAPGRAPAPGPATAPAPAPPPSQEPTPVTPAPPPSPGPAATSPPGPAPLSPPSATKDQPGARESRTVTIADGTVLPVSLLEKISSDTHQPGDSFSATLTQALVIDGLVICDKGARVSGKVTEAEKAGRVKGVSHLTLELTELTTADGQKVAIRTQPFVKEGAHTQGNDATKVAVGSAIGAAIGAIAGGGRGAAIGAGAGAGAGAGTVLATRGKPTELGVETRLSFRVSGAVKITEKLK